MADNSPSPTLPPDHKSHLQTSKSPRIRIRFSRPTHDVFPGFAEGSVLVGRAPQSLLERCPGFTDRKHGVGTEPQSMNYPTSVRRSLRSLPVARVHLSGDLDTSLIDEVFRENIRQVSNCYQPVGHDLHIVRPESTCHHPAHLPSASGQERQAIATEVTPLSRKDGCVGAVGHTPSPKPRRWFLGNRGNMCVTFQEETPVDFKHRTLAVQGKHYEPRQNSAREGQAASGEPTRITAKFIIRRRTKEQCESDSDSGDKIDISQRPSSGIRRSMSLRLAPRPVWTPEQSLTVTTDGANLQPVKLSASLHLRLGSKADRTREHSERTVNNIKIGSETQSPTAVVHQRRVATEEPPTR